MLFKVAWRNIWRNKTRSLVIILSVTIGMWAGIFVIAFYNGMAEQRITSAIQTEISHLQLHHPSFREDYDVQYSLPNGKQILHTVIHTPYVRTAAGRIIVKGMISSPSGSSGVTINGVMPKEEDYLTSLQSKLTAGNYFTGNKKNELLVGKKLLDKMKLKLNAKVVLTAQDREGNIVAGAFRIVGMYKTVNTPYDETNVFANIKDVDALIGVGGELNEIAVLLHSNNQLTLAEEQFKMVFPQAEVQSWMQISPQMGLTISATDQTTVIFMGVILLALAFGIINTMLMAVLERTREIGMLLALGMNKVRVFSMILLETFFLVLAGCPAGILFALITVWYTNHSGISLKQFSDAYASFGYSDIVYPSLTLRQFVFMMAMVIVTVLVSSLFPARRALTLKPAEAIRK